MFQLLTSFRSTVCVLKHVSIRMPNKNEILRRGAFSRRLRDARQSVNLKVPPLKTDYIAAAVFFNYF